MSNNDYLVDGHVHFFTEDDLNAVSAELPYDRPEPNPLSVYLQDLEAKGRLPTLINNVHLSVLPNSENIFSSFKELADLKKKFPGKFDKVRLVGTIKADPVYANEERLSHPQVVGVRIVLHDAPEESIASDAYSTPAWQTLYGRLAAHQHVHVYAQAAATNHRVLRQIPDDVRVVIDHLGTCHANLNADDGAFTKLLEEAHRRGNVWFKGPGYRTSTDIQETVPFVVRIIKALGAEKLLLQATDAPHVGADQSARAYRDLFHPSSAFDFVQQLASAASQHCGVPADELLNGAASAVFPNMQTNRTQVTK
ncbi:amidohydrolase family protein [Bordetella genomosp. 4]|uniref:Metal-dependent hydrolase n=1 Tax=Bordetella genomosp. 4 TaxID=463044 RepID=A0A261UU20_9BORD|nr:amidohydrolase family protein [Bordetella genomosp. 4]OZI64842.1 metal-dependent hydrolase [Bordetella genomosp. 4]